MITAAAEHVQALATRGGGQPAGEVFRLVDPVQVPHQPQPRVLHRVTASAVCCSAVFPLPSALPPD